MAESSRRFVRGEEAELFERYHRRLIRATAHQVVTTPENVDEACAFAWVQLLAHDVRRETAYAWLKEVARREAIRLAKLDRTIVPLGQEPGALDPELLPSNRGNPDVTPDRWEGALARLRELPERDARAVAMRAFGWRYEDIGRELGVNTARVNQILTRADMHLYELEERERPARTAKVARLRQLETDPPRYLRDAIGALPKISRKSGLEGIRLEWRRLALAIEDYRTAFGVSDPRRAFGPHPRTRGQRWQRDQLRERIDRYVVDLDRARG